MQLVLVMTVVAVAVVVYLLVLYCLQQRRQGHRRTRVRGSVRRLARAEHNIDSDLDTADGDNTSLDMPPPNYHLLPPTYDEVVNTDQYPVSRRGSLQRNMRISSFDEPITPPPNYDAALDIIANSYYGYGSMCPSKPVPVRPVVRRCISTDITSASGGPQSARMSASHNEHRRVFSSRTENSI